MKFSRRALLGGPVTLSAALRAERRLVGARATGYSVMDLGASSETIQRGHDWSDGRYSDINEKGEVGGALVVSPEKISPTIWSADGKQTQLTSGTYGGEVRALNSRGLAVGLEYLDVLGISDGEYSGYKYLPAAWQNGERIELPMPEDIGTDPANLSGIAFDTNENGQIIGHFGYPKLRRSQPVIWRDGAIETLLPVSDLGKTVGYYINSSGTAAGTVEHVRRFPDGRVLFFDYPVLWIDGKLEVLDGPEGVVFPQSLDENRNVSLQVFGLSDKRLLLALVITTTSDGSSYRSYVYDRGTWTPLLSPSVDYPEILALAISPTGVVVGTVGTVDSWHSFASRRQVVWIDGSPRDITDTLPDLGDLDVLRLLAVNSDGVILANAYDANHAYHGLVLTPN